MARIRTIKPEFWTDEKIVQLPYQARLAFIGLWNFCDDEGRLMDEPDRIKMQVLPADDVNMEIGIDILVSSGLIERYENEESSVLVIKNFLEHQVISHPAKSKIKMGEYKRRAIPMAERRKLAKKYGCVAGADVHDAECYFCGTNGSIWWPKKNNGQPSYWVAFSGLEVDHFKPVSDGGTNDVENLIFSCRSCNRSKGKNGAFEYAEYVSENITPESSRGVQKGYVGSRGF